MTTLPELIQEINLHVRRPDLAAVMESHVKNSILKLHTKDFWKRDLVEANFNFAAPSPVYTFAYKAIFPDFRKPKYLRTVDSDTGQTILTLSAIDITEIKDRYGRLKDYAYYMAGDNIQIRATDSPQYFAIGYYKYPDLTLTRPSWIVEEYPNCVIYDVARTMFLSIGYQEQAAGMRELYNETYATLLMAGIVDEGE